MKTPSPTPSRLRTRLLGGALLIATAGLTACGGGGYHRPPYYPEPPKQPPVDIKPYTPAVAYDQDIAERVRRYLGSDPRVGVETLVVNVENQVVYLSGNAKSPEAARLAVAMAERVQGVRKVISTMNVY
ncbi:BON domain-containing protein [Tibeticola sp.]|uniref:BON domain-containing protein n=1 Tax=Tibeticola sp. TaxID=2005368 RepID=UPI0025D6D7E9|nr:BON domain-containing protein [Tibeticola sp.]